MSSVSLFPSLRALQSSFAASLSGLSSGAAAQALTDLRQVSAFSGLSNLEDLVSQDAVARLVFKPSLFAEAGNRLKAFQDLEALGGVSRMPSIKERLKACASLLELRHGVQIYGAMLVHQDKPDTLETIQSSMSRALKDELNWSQTLTAEPLGAFALSVRKAFDAHGDHLSGEQRHDLMQIAFHLSEAAGGTCAFDAGQADSPVQARKVAVLGDVIYGSGFGDDGWEIASDGLKRLARHWGKQDTAKREDALKRSAAAAKGLMEEAKASYAALFDPIGATPGFRFNGAINALSAHLAALLP
ncbi:MAG TPA: hypothetical protein VFX30_13020 [bacterium]|nr:hypothetical protein [bacterium]